MNAYFIITQQEYGIDELPWELSRGFPQYYDKLWDLLFAETRGKARAMFAHVNRRYIDFTDPVHIKTVAKNVSRHKGFAKSNDILWMWVYPASLADAPFNEVADIIINDYRDYPVELG